MASAFIALAPPCHSPGEPQHDGSKPCRAVEPKIWIAGGFPRYSQVLKSSGIVWNDDTLDEWIKDPQHFIAGNTMTFPGREGRPAAGRSAGVSRATRSARPAPSVAAQGGGLRACTGRRPKCRICRSSMPEDRVRSINHCGDTYNVTTADGKVRDFWERNLRFKTDVSSDGPQKGVPALVGAGMMGDRADVIFASPEEISGFISHQC